MITPLNQMTELWRGIARLHRSDSVCQAAQRGRLQQHSLGVLADTIASLMNCYGLALDESESESNVAANKPIPERNDDAQL